jgi:NAD(P)-dependent dehydrogenase (short-subunit alcohol dehydrogenase family)
MADLAAHPLISLQTLDVTSDEDVRHVVHLIVAEAGHIDVIVNNGSFGSCSRGSGTV